jgi:hypothetical protein
MTRRVGVVAIGLGLVLAACRPAPPAARPWATPSADELAALLAARVGAVR